MALDELGSQLADDSRGRRPTSGRPPRRCWSASAARRARARAAACASTWAWRPASARPTPCSRKGRRRKERGTDVVVGFVETYGRPLTEQAIGDLEVIPRKKIAYKGVALEEMDTEAVIARDPQVALVDELAHTNAPGSKHEKRWQDVYELLDPGITVISTVNIQHLESLADIVETITGVPVRERIPERSSTRPTRSRWSTCRRTRCAQRIRHGNIYPPERAEQALHSSSARATSTRCASWPCAEWPPPSRRTSRSTCEQHHIEARLAGRRARHGLRGRRSPDAQRVIRRGWRVANRLQRRPTGRVRRNAEWAPPARKSACTGREPALRRGPRRRGRARPGSRMTSRPSDAGRPRQERRQHRRGPAAGGRLRLLLGRSPVPKRPAGHRRGRARGGPAQRKTEDRWRTDDRHSRPRRFSNAWRRADASSATGAAREAAAADHGGRRALPAHPVLATGPRSVLEIGASGGYSTIWLGTAARAVGGAVTTLEMDPVKVRSAGEPAGGGPGGR